MPVILEVENLFKEYQLGVISHDTLYRDLQSLWAKILNKDDPNSIIGSNKSNIKTKYLALNNINLKVQEGEVLGIIGANGAGKSTLLKIISRVTTPTKGIIRAKGKISSLLEVGTGFHFELTGRENIYLNGAINGMNRTEVSKKLDEIVDFSGIETFLDTPIKRYSSGMNVRLGFAVAAYLEPEILVVDEVLAVGDAGFQKKALQKMEEVSSKFGRTVLFVSHNTELVKNLCNRAVLLEDGKIINEGAANEVVNYYLESAASKTTGAAVTIQDDPDQNYQVLGFGILSDLGEKSDYLDRTKPFKIFIDYILRKSSDSLNVQFGVSTASSQDGINIDTIVFQWSEKHYKKYKFNDEKLLKKPGKYRAYITFPGYLINSGKYKLQVKLAKSGTLYNFPKQYVIFELYDSDSSHLFKQGRSGGIIATPLDWDEQIL